MNKLNIHALPTDDGVISRCRKGYSEDHGNINYKTDEFRIETDGHRDWWKSYHIYLTDDSPIKEGDWCVNSAKDILLKASENDADTFKATGCFEYIEKIIATTDPKLMEYIQPTGTVKGSLPSISQQDLPKIADALNNRVTSVGCEMVRDFDKQEHDMTLPPIEWNYPKTKDGCIVLDWGEVEELIVWEDDKSGRYIGGFDPYKEKMYTKEEVVNKFDKFLRDADGTEGGLLNHLGKMIFNRDLFTLNFDMDKWIKDNLT